MAMSRGEAELRDLQTRYPLAGIQMNDVVGSITEKINKAYRTNYGAQGLSGNAYGGTPGGETGLVPGTLAPGSTTSYGVREGQTPQYSDGFVAPANAAQGATKKSLDQLVSELKTSKPVAPTTPSTSGYWTEGKIVNGINVGGGVFMPGSAPAIPVTPTALRMPTVPNTSAIPTAAVASDRSPTASTNSTSYSVPTAPTTPTGTKPIAPATTPISSSETSNELIDKLLKSFTPSSGETDLQTKLANIEASRRLSYQDIEKQPIATPFITGQEAAVTKGLQNEQQNVSGQLANLQAQRQATTGALSTALGYQQKMNTPTEVSPGASLMDSSGNIIGTAPTAALTTAQGTLGASTPTSVSAGGYSGGSLDVGSSGEDVTALQNFLISNGYDIPAGATGYYGAQTQAAVAEFQKAMGVDTSAGGVGTFGPKTQAAASGKGLSTGGASSVGNPSALTGIASEVYKNPSLYGGLTPTQKGDVIKQFGSAGISTATLTGAKGSVTGEQKNEIDTLDSVAAQANQIITLGEQIGWSGVGGLWQGSMSQFLAKNFGTGSEQEQSLRNMIGSVKGAIAKLRGGTSFTPNEEKLLDTYVPSIDDSPLVIKSKVGSLIGFINQKKQIVMGTSKTTGNNNPLGI